MTTLLVIAKEPRPGRVKTRLTPPFTPEEAAALAEASLADTLRRRGARRPARRRVLVLDGRARAPGCRPASTSYRSARAASTNGWPRPSRAATARPSSSAWTPPR